MFLMCNSHQKCNLAFSFISKIRNVAVPFPTKREAEIVYNVLRVDEEPKRGGTKKTLKLVDSTLHVYVIFPIVSSILYY